MKLRDAIARLGTVFIVMGLALYPVLELTRVALLWGNYFPERVDFNYWGELAFMWVVYLMIAPVIYFMWGYRRKG